MSYIAVVLLWIGLGDDKLVIGELTSLQDQTTSIELQSTYRRRYYES